LRITRYLSSGFLLALAVPACVLAMQLPALTADYETGLIQSARELRASVDRHERAVRAQYAIDAQDDGGLIATLQKVEPAHAKALGDDILTWQRLSGAADRIASVSPLLQPFAAMVDLADDPNGDRREVWRTSRDRYEIRLTLDAAAISYGFAGFLVGALVAQTVLGCGGLIRRARRRRLRARRT
jgi:hypothetical protein